MQMTISEEDIREITDAVWISVLQSPTVPRRCLVSACDEVVFTGCVQMKGAWEGAVTIQCSDRLAKVAAATMFDGDAAKISVDDVRDALGELANMVGGNIKALLPGPTHLSMPVVVVGSNKGLSICDVVPVYTVAFESFGEEFTVSLLKRSPGG